MWLPMLIWFENKSQPYVAENWLTMPDKLDNACIPLHTTNFIVNSFRYSKRKVRALKEI